MTRKDQKRIAAALRAVKTEHPGLLTPTTDRTAWRHDAAQHSQWCRDVQAMADAVTHGVAFDEADRHTFLVACGLV